jgi:hypothetical protein
LLVRYEIKVVAKYSQDIVKRDDKSTLPFLTKVKKGAVVETLL